MRSHIIKVLSFLLFCSGALIASDYWVATTGDDLDPGNSASPFRTITKGLMVAGAGDTVWVRAGTYDAAGGESFPITMKSGVVLISESGAEATIVDAGGASRVMLCNGNVAGTRIEGFTITGGLHFVSSVADGGGGIFFGSNDRTTIARNIILENEVRGANGASGFAGGDACGGGVAMHNAMPSIVNNVFRGNIARGGHGGSGLGDVVIGAGGNGGAGRGGGLCWGGSFGNGVFQNTFFQNQAFGGNGGDGIPNGSGGNSSGGGAQTGAVETINNIFAFNSAQAGPIFLPGVATAGGLLKTSGLAQFNLFFANTPDDGSTGSDPVLGQDPLFLGPPADLDIDSGSPAEGAGKVIGIAQDFDRLPRPTPPSIGAFEAPLIAADDFTGDGLNDLFWRQPSTGKNVVWGMDGASRLDYASMLTVPGIEWSIAGTGHFNGDADPDLLWRNSSSGQNVAWGMDGHMRTSYASLLTVPSPWEIGGVDDFDDDGDADIVWRNPSSGQNVLWTMDGAVRTGYSSMLSVVGMDWRIAGVGDFDADGKPDLLWRNATSGQNVIWFMDGANRTSYASTLTVVGSAWRIQAVSDYDGDGHSDIVWRNVSTGQNVIWFMDGASRTSFATTLMVTDFSWEMQSPK